MREYVCACSVYVGGRGSEEQAEEEGERIRCGAEGEGGSAAPPACCELILSGTPRGIWSC